METKSLRCALCTLLLFISFTCQSLAQDFSLGTRGGASFNGDADRFRQIEAFADLNLPWQWNIASNWFLTPRLDLSLGCLDNHSADAFIGSAGPALELRRNHCPLTLEGGCCPTFLSRYQFGEKDFGDRFQFTSHIGLNWDITRNFSLDWRFQHMSNAGISPHNPGLNLQMISASYRF